MQETVDGLLSLLQSPCSGWIDEDSGDNSSSVSSEDLLMQVLTLLPIVISPEPIDVQVATLLLQ